MRRARVVVGLAAVPLLLGVAGASTRPASGPTTWPADRVIGRTYGHDVTAGEVQVTGPIDTSVDFDATDDARWEMMGRISRAFGDPVLEKFYATRNVRPTTREMELCIANMQKNLDQELAEAHAEAEAARAEARRDGLSAEAKKAANEKLEQAERGEKTMADLARPPHDDTATLVIIGWKAEHELYRVYGGRVIFQQLGLEALDARRLLFEDAEKRGDLRFDDPGVRWMFYHYSRMSHMEADPKDLEKAWFLEPVTRPAAPATRP